MEPEKPKDNKEIIVSPDTKIYYKPKDDSLNVVVSNVSEIKGIPPISIASIPHVDEVQLKETELETKSIKFHQTLRNTGLVLVLLPIVIIALWYLIKIIWK